MQIVTYLALCILLCIDSDAFPFRKQSDETCSPYGRHENHSNKKYADEKKLNEEDLRHYEQMVMMKKYPFLDLKEFDLKYHPWGKNVKLNVKFSGHNINDDPAICEPPAEDIPSIEISNRGLTGLSIPQIRANLSENKLKSENLQMSQDISKNKKSVSRNQGKDI